MGVSSQTIRKIFKTNNDNNATLAERIARSKAAVRKAKALLRKSETKLKPKLLTMSDEMRKESDRLARNKRINENAKAMLKESKRQERMARQDPPKPTVDEIWETRTVVWRGQRIKVEMPKWKGKDII